MQSKNRITEFYVFYQLGFRVSVPVFNENEKIRRVYLKSGSNDFLETR